MSSTSSETRRSGRKRKAATRNLYSPEPFINRKRLSEVFQDDILPIDGEGRLTRKSQESNGEKSNIKTIVKKEYEAEEKLQQQNDSGNYDSASISEMDEEEEVTSPQLLSQSSGDNEQHAAAGFSESRESSSSSAYVLPQEASSSSFGVGATLDTLAALKNLNKKLFDVALKEPIQKGNALVVIIKLLAENESSSVASNSVVEFLQKAEKTSRQLINNTPILLQKPRISLDKAWDSVAITYGLYGPTIVPIVLHFIRQLHVLEEKFYTNPSALFCYTFMVVKLFHEHVMPLLSPQISVCHSWILDILEQPFLRSYLTLAHWLKYFEPRVASTLITDPNVAAYRVVENFMNELVSDPYSSLITQLKPIQNASSNVTVLFPTHLIKNDKFALIAMLFRGLDNLGYSVKQLPRESDVQNEFAALKAADPKALVFVGQTALQQSHISTTFGSICFTFDMTFQSLEPSKNDFPKILQLSTTKSDGKCVNEDSLVFNNITPACICRYYLEHISIFVESFIKEQQQ